MESILRSHVPAGSRLLVAVSGGPDSVALLHQLKGLSYDLVVGHVDHRLRPSSRRDAAFVRRLAGTWDIPYLEKRVSVSGWARKHKQGIEEAARNVRYQALAEMAKQTKCTAIVTGHTADDQAETVLMHFLRGTGPAGLAGMPASRDVLPGKELPILRPLLVQWRSDVEAYLRRHKLPSRQDPTNANDRFTRNRIRRTVLPYLGRLYPGLRERLVQMADIFREEEDFWAQNDPVVLTRVLGYHKALARRILRRRFPGSSFKVIEQARQVASIKKKGR